VIREKIRDFREVVLEERARRERILMLDAYNYLN